MFADEQVQSEKNKYKKNEKIAAHHPN